MTQMIIALAAAFIICAAATYVEIPILKKTHSRQAIREEGPESHQAKAGTPTMGGIAIILATVVTALAGTKCAGDAVAVVLVFVLFGLIGFLDDFIKVTKKHNLGLRAWQKLVLQIVIAGALAFYISRTAEHGTTVTVPFVNAHLDLGAGFVPFIAFVAVAMANGVNLTDGLDGLAAGVTALVSLFLAAAGLVWGIATQSTFCAAMCGACLGFLLFNKNPAKVFMGDTGSLALGGGLAATAAVMDLELLLPICGLIYVLEVLSVIIQVASFKTRGKRVFRMAPLHHHFELGGMSERKVVKMFWGITAVCCAVCVLALI